MLQSIDKLNHLFLGLLKLVYLNFLWLLLSIAGLGIFSLGPATYALVSVLRKGFRSTEVFPITKTFWFFFKENYKEALLVSWIYGIIGIILIVDFYHVSNWYIRIILSVVMFAYWLSLIYIFPIMAHYNWQGIFFKMKMAFLFGFSHLHYSFVLIVAIVSSYWVAMHFFPGILTFIGGSFLMFMITWGANQLFRQLEIKNATEVEHKSIYKIVKEKYNEKSKVNKASKY